MLLGSVDQSVGWNLVTKQVHFNDCVVGRIPRDASDDVMLPSVVCMIVDMERGALSFKAEGVDVAVGLEGLKRMGEKLYIAAALDTPGDSIKVTYKGQVGAKKQLTLISWHLDVQYMYMYMYM